MQDQSSPDPVVRRSAAYRAAAAPGMPRRARCRHCSGSTGCRGARVAVIVLVPQDAAARPPSCRSAGRGASCGGRPTPARLSSFPSPASRTLPAGRQVRAPARRPGAASAKAPRLGSKSDRRGSCRRSKNGRPRLTLTGMQRNRPERTRKMGRVAMNQRCSGSSGAGPAPRSLLRLTQNAARLPGRYAGEAPSGTGTSPRRVGPGARQAERRRRISRAVRLAAAACHVWDLAWEAVAPFSRSAGNTGAALEKTAAKEQAGRGSRLSQKRDKNPGPEIVRASTGTL